MRGYMRVKITITASVDPINIGFLTAAKEKIIDLFYETPINLSDVNCEVDSRKETPYRLTLASANTNRLSIREYSFIDMAEAVDFGVKLAETLSGPWRLISVKEIN
jgi:hypothetical protein